VLNFGAMLCSVDYRSSTYETIVQCYQPVIAPIRKQLSKTAIFILPFTLIICLILLWILRYSLYEWLTAEDHLVENLQYMFYLLSSVATLLIVIRFFKIRNISFGAFYLGLAFASFVIAIEEISWGQRIFHISTPGFIEKHN
jgi:hypothetical protein